jgi:hypothetical protein
MGQDFALAQIHGIADIDNMHTGMAVTISLLAGIGKMHRIVSVFGMQTERPKRPLPTRFSN